jgi:Ca2+-binding EF-hand superfamily protein
MFAKDTAEEERVTCNETRRQSVFDFKSAVTDGVFEELLLENNASELRMYEHMTEKKITALRGLFNAADDDGGGSIGADELFHVLADEHLGGDLAKGMRSSLAGFSERFIDNMFHRLDQNADGHFDFPEFG